MADYLPKFESSDNAGIVVGTGGVSAGELIDASTGIATSGAVASVIGVAGRDAAAGETVNTYSGHVGIAVSAGSFSKGVPLKSAASGRVVAWVSGTDDASLIVAISLAASTGSAQSILAKFLR